MRGVAINPSTPWPRSSRSSTRSSTCSCSRSIPGWGGQAFLPSTGRRLDEARRLIEASGRPIALGVDGGVTRDNIAAVAALGADVIVSGSAIFDGTAAVAANAEAMLAAVRAAGRAAVPA